MAKNKKNNKAQTKQVKKSKSSKRANRRSKRRAAAVRKAAITEAGEMFLKCGFAGVDFPGISGAGVPDRYGGPSLRIRHRTTVTFTGNAWFAMLPTPGVAVWSSGTDPATGGAFAPTYFSDASSLFPPAGNGSEVVERFRIISHTLEVKPVSAVLNNAGMFNVARLPGIEVTEQVSASTVMSKYIDGMDSVTQTAISAQAGARMFHVNEGFYTFAINEGGEWDFSPIIVGTSSLWGSDPGEGSTAVLSGRFLGFGNTTPIGISFTGSNSSTSYAMTIEMCVEYVPRAGTMLAEMAAPSPPYDPVALDVYSRAARSLPSSVPAAENKGFWDKVLSVVSSAAGLLAPIAGVYAPVVAGVGMVASGIRSLFVSE